MNRHRPLARLALLALLLSTVGIDTGCRSLRTPDEPASAREPTTGPLESRASLRARLVPADLLSPEISMRQRLRFIAGERDGEIDAVVQLTCGELVVVGLTPIGTRLFTIRQTGRDVDARLMLPGDWPFEPERVLLSLQRSMLLPLPRPPEAGAVDEADPGIWLGRTPFEIALEERWLAGRVVERRVHEARASGPATIEIRYSAPGLDTDSIPRSTTIESEKDGYRIEIETLEQTRLPCEDPSEPESSSRGPGFGSATSRHH